MIILDTDHVSLLEWTETPESRALLERLRASSDKAVFVTVVSFEEQMRGWMAALAQAAKIARQIEAYRRLGRMLRSYCRQPIVEFDERAAAEFQRIRKSCRRIGAMDLKIAAIALANNALLLTRNSGDFSQVPGLKFDDWTKEALS